MNLVDSSGWLEYFTDGKNAKVFAPIIEHTDDLIVSPINIFEIFKKILAEKNEHTAVTMVAFMQQAKTIEVSSSIALQAAKISHEQKLPMADSLIYATARSQDAIVWTQDSHFMHLDGVKYFPK
jgi:predicted nucleic acid-binding protein